MQENEQPLKAWTGCYKIKYLNEQPEITEEEHFNAVFSKLEKIQRQVMLTRIKKAEALLTSIEDDLNSFLVKDGQ